MANGFQADAPNVRFAPSGAQPLLPDTSRAETISALGEFAGGVRREVMSTGLRRSFGRLAEEVNALNTTPAQEINVEGMTEAELDNLSTTERSLRRLRIARQQGRISEAQVQIEAEKILQDSVQAAPGFENDFRRLAASTLGFDPTGATVQTLLAGATAQREPTVFDTWMEEGAAVERATGGAITQEMYVQSKGEETFVESRNDTRKAQVSLGNMDADRFISESVTDMVAPAAKNFLLTGIFQRTEDGGLTPADSVDAAKLQASLTAEKQRLQDEIIANAQEADVILTPEKLNSLREQVDARFKPIQEVANNLDLAEQVSRNWTILRDSYRTNAYKMFQDVALANELGIQREYFDLLQYPERYREIMLQLDPSLGPAFQINEQGKAELQSLERLINGALDLSDQGNREVFTSYVDANVESRDAETQKRGLEKLFSSDKPMFSLSHLAKEGYSKGKIDPSNREFAAEEANLRIKTFLQSQPAQQLAEEIRQLRERGTEVEILTDGNRLRVRAQREAPQRRTLGQPRAATGLSARAQNLIEKINSIEAVAENGWGSDLDDWNPSFIEQQRQQILDALENSEEQQ